MWIVMLMVVWGAAGWGEPARDEVTPPQPTAAPAEPATTQPASVNLFDARLGRALAYVPSDAHIVIVVPDIEALLNGLTTFGTAIGAPLLAEVDAERLLGAAIGAAVSAVELRGPLVFALPRDYGDPVLITTIGCQTTWAGCTEAKRLADGLTIYELGPQSFVGATEGDVVIFARDSADLRTATGGNRRFLQQFREAVGNDLERRHLIAYIDVAAVHAEWNERLNLILQTLYLGMATSGTDVEIAGLVWNFLIEQARTTLSEARTCVVGLQLDREGVFMEARARFTPDGSIAKYLRQVRPSQRDLFRGLPAGPASFAVSYEWVAGPDTVSLNDAMMKAMFGSEVVRRQIGAEAADRLQQRCTELNRMVPGVSAAFSLRPKTGMLYWGLYLTERPSDTLREFKAITELAPEFLTAWGTFPAAMRPQPAFELAGEQVESFAFDIDESELQFQPMMGSFYGEDPTLYIAKHAEGLAYAFGPQVAAREQLARLLARDLPSMAEDPRVQALRQRLTPGAQSLLVADLGLLAREVLGMLSMLGLPAPTLELSADEQPLAGYGFYMEQDVVRLEAFVPSTPLKAISEAAAKVTGTAADPPF